METTAVVIVGAGRRGWRRRSRSPPGGAVPGRRPRRRAVHRRPGHRGEHGRDGTAAPLGHPRAGRGPGPRRRDDRVARAHAHADRGGRRRSRSGCSRATQARVRQPGAADVPEPGAARADPRSASAHAAGGEAPNATPRSRACGRTRTASPSRSAGARCAPRLRDRRGRDPQRRARGRGDRAGRVRPAERLRRRQVRAPLCRSCRGIAVTASAAAAATAGGWRSSRSARSLISATSAARDEGRRRPPLTRLVRDAAGVADPARAIDRMIELAARHRARTPLPPGPCLPRGDAAHRVTPRGATGLSTALISGEAIAWRLGWVLRPGRAGAAQRLSRDRRPIASANRALVRSPAPSALWNRTKWRVDVGGRIAHAWAAPGISTSTSSAAVARCSPARTQWVGRPCGPPPGAPVRVHALPTPAARALGITGPGALMTRPDGVPARHLGRATTTSIR